MRRINVAVVAPIFILLSGAAVSASHVIQKAFNVPLGTPAGDLEKRGFRANEFGVGDSWVRTDDKFFDRITVRVSASLSLIEAITASKRYDDGDRDQRRDACEADFASISAVIQAKYPALRKAKWLKREDGLDGLLGYYRKRLLEEPTSKDSNPSPARSVSLTCFGPSGLDTKYNKDTQTMLLVSYQISELERVPINRAFRLEKQKRERDRARVVGIDSKTL